MALSSHGWYNNMANKTTAANLSKVNVVAHTSSVKNPHTNKLTSDQMNTFIVGQSIVGGDNIVK